MIKKNYNDEIHFGLQKRFGRLKLKKGKVHIKHLSRAFWAYGHYTHNYPTKYTFDKEMF